MYLSCFVTGFVGQSPFRCLFSLESSCVARICSLTFLYCLFLFIYLLTLFLFSRPLSDPVALYKSWKLGLALLSVLVALLVVSSLFAKYAIKYTMMVMSSVSDANTLAEESISSAKTVQSLWAQAEVGSKYAEKINISISTGRSRALVCSVCVATFTFIVYSGYALAFYFGARLVRDDEITPGIIITVFLSIVMASFALAQVPPNLQSELRVERLDEKRDQCLFFSSRASLIKDFTILNFFSRFSLRICSHFLQSLGSCH